jgi:hypothetical protein
MPSQVIDSHERVGGLKDWNVEAVEKTIEGWLRIAMSCTYLYTVSLPPTVVRVTSVEPIAASIVSIRLIVSS